MTYYRIESSAGVEMGVFEADSPEAALDAMARDAGCASDAEAAEIVGKPFEGWVKPVPVYRVRTRDSGGWILGDYARAAHVEGDVGTLIHSTLEDAEAAARAIEACPDASGFAPRCFVEEVES